MFRGTFPSFYGKAVVQAAVDRNLVHEELHSEVEYIVAHGISSMIENKKLSLEVIILYSKMSSVQFLEGKEELFEKLPEECLAFIYGDRRKTCRCDLY